MTMASANMVSGHLNKHLCDTKKKVYRRFTDDLGTCYVETAVLAVSRIIAPRLSKAATRISC
jgi:hypothetical protein